VINPPNRAPVAVPGSRRPGVVVVLFLALVMTLRAHDPSSAPITWNREMSRIVYERCASCHRAGGNAFSLMTYQEAQPRAAAIKDAVLSRRMPPWGAVKGFGNFKNEMALTQEQISLVTDWVEGGTARGNNRNALPPLPTFGPTAEFRLPEDTIAVTDGMALVRDVTIAGLYPAHIPKAASMQVVATRPDGSIEPLVWLYEYQDRYRHPFEFRRPLQLPAGSVIHGMRGDAKILLIQTAGGKK
jgi:mono/diheme cytochrome c family protein